LIKIGLGYILGRFSLSSSGHTDFKVDRVAVVDFGIIFLNYSSIANFWVIFSTVQVMYSI
jgi:hypothetical protein